MKKIITILLLVGLLFSYQPLNAKPSLQDAKKSEKVTKKLSHQKKQMLKKEHKKPLTPEQLKEKQKKEIEAREKSIDRTKPVKKVSSDENLPQTVRKRNIP